MGENSKKDGQGTTLFSITERKTSIQILLSYERIWKITSDVFIVFFLRVVHKRPYNK